MRFFFQYHKYPKFLSRSQLIWFLTAFLALIIACSPDKKEIEGKNGILKLLGPTAYKGLNNQMVVEGMVENKSDRSLEEIVVIVSWYDQDKEFLSSMKKEIAPKVLSPHKFYTYRLESEFDPRMDNYSIGFFDKQKELISVYHFQYIEP